MDRRGDSLGEKVLAINVHGDAAFAGQGVVMETFQMSQTRGFYTGGTIHIILNNQIGYTVSEQADARSAHYCTEVAKMVQAPIFHVNGDDPEAVIFVSRLAADYRMEFKKDVVIDLICYRRRGHNEGDEPSITQPMMYKKIRNYQTTQEIYAKKLMGEGLIEEREHKNLVEAYRDSLDKGNAVAWDYLTEPDTSMHVDWTPYLGHEWDMLSDTSCDLKAFQQLAKALHEVPEGFVLQKQVGKIWEDRRKMGAGAMAINWGFAENMAYATLLDEGHSIRLTGQDVGRGTFSHRHAILHDQKAGETHTPLSLLVKETNSFSLYDSFLSEEAVLAFEYGYSSTSPGTLVIWEAQFGDFANGAQVVIDQFITSGEHKWARLSGLTMLLPHGYEGAGPEHSSARLERYLQLSAENNIQVCVPSTPSQIFHLLRRQAIRPLRKPLIVMTPKSLLRHKEAVSSIEDLVNGSYELVIDELNGRDPEEISHVVMCSGKVFYDLEAKRLEGGLDNVAIIRIEQLYPFPKESLRAVLEKYKNLTGVVWCQEEPENQGAWYSTQHYFKKVIKEIDPTIELDFAGRDASAAAAAGYMTLHVRQQEKLIEDALIGTQKKGVLDFGR